MEFYSSHSLELIPKHTTGAFNTDFQSEYGTVDLEYHVNPDNPDGEAQRLAESITNKVAKRALRGKSTLSVLLVNENEVTDGMQLYRAQHPKTLRETIGKQLKRILRDEKQLSLKVFKHACVDDLMAARNEFCAGVFLQETYEVHITVPADHPSIALRPNVKSPIRRYHLPSAPPANYMVDTERPAYRWLLEKRYTDILISCADGTLSAHALQLAKKSESIRQKLEKTKGKLNLQAYPCAVIEQLLRSVYLGSGAIETNTSPVHLRALIQVAKDLDLPDLKGEAVHLYDSRLQVFGEFAKAFIAAVKSSDDWVIKHLNKVAGHFAHARLAPDMESLRLLYGVLKGSESTAATLWALVLRKLKSSKITSEELAEIKAWTEDSRDLEIVQQSATYIHFLERTKFKQ